MLPSARHSLERGGMSEKSASWVLITLFLVGAVGIQFLSQVMHRMLPSHVVNCDHTHDDEVNGEEMENCPDEESQPVITASHDTADDNSSEIDPQRIMSMPLPKSGSLHSTSYWKNWLKTTKSDCGSKACHGYSNPCGDCFKNLNARGEVTIPRPHIPRSLTEGAARPTEGTPLLSTVPEEVVSSSSSTLSNSKSTDHNHKDNGHEHLHDHHHHVPTNAFLSIGLQTSIAIALHKLPEGFITFATNHANPRLGVAVFLSLFIHNISEGFALALPLYLALQSRTKAMVWSVILGSLSQPLGAGIAALWFHLAGNSSMAPSETVYGGMFAIVAGIMTSVALQLMGESLELTHDRGLCFTFAFIGMGILGISSALTASS
jgi:zinc transporter, ZIP family